MCKSLQKNRSWTKSDWDFYKRNSLVNMHIISIIIYSNSLKSLSYFTSFFNFVFKKFFKNFIIKNFFKKLYKNKTSVLKSPHVHKNAQEQFYKKLYKKN